MAKEGEEGKKMWWVCIPILVSFIVGAAGSGTVMIIRQSAAIAAQCKEMADLKAEGCGPARESKTNIAVMQRDIETIKSNMAEQRTMATRQVELSQKILEKLNKP